ncbi:MAG: polysaccharide deacetylase family protein [Flavobacterium sp.]|nr:polysaccharide deacetylase family protein [Flavobacterium sp.]
MKLYWIKTHKFVRLIAKGLLWNIPNKRKAIYLTFDDGPTPEITNWVLDQLAQYKAKATFFCIGKNAQAHPEICREIKAQGHQIGNHTQNHSNGWKTSARNYINDFEKCKKTMETILNEEVKLFRPPYGKIGWKAYSKIKKQGYTIVMWDVLSADFDSQTNDEKCLANVLNNIESGSIVVFHDSQKCYATLREVLPKTLAFLHENKFCCEVIA